jgi:hypothetical protein
MSVNTTERKRERVRDLGAIILIERERERDGDYH